MEAATTEGWRAKETPEEVNLLRPMSPAPAGLFLAHMIRFLGWLLLVPPCAWIAASGMWIRRHQVNYVLSGVEARSVDD